MSTPPPQRAPTSLPLILLTLLTGVALGWLLRDVVFSTIDDRRPTTVIQQPAASSQQLATPRVSGSQQSTAEGSASTAVALVPTVAPSPTRAAPTVSVPSPVPIVPTPAPEPPTPDDRPPASYTGHTVAEGETLASIAARAGSTADRIRRYNLLNGEPPPGRALIIPRINPQQSPPRSAPLLVQRGRSDKPWVALTLDAGAGATPVPQMLDTLRERGVTLTFFLTGTWIKEHPELAKRIVADGHEIANHTFNHPDLTRASTATMQTELADTEAVMQQIAGTSTRPFFRPPYGAYDERVLRVAEREGYLPVYWTLDSLDSIGEPKTPQFLLDRVTGALPPDKLQGAIILAHCGSQPTADALPLILDRFEEMGFEVKKLSAVLGG